MPDCHLQAFRPGIVDLPTGASEAPSTHINVQNFGDFDAGIEFRGILEGTDLNTFCLSAPDAWVAATGQNRAR